MKFNLNLKKVNEAKNSIVGLTTLGKVKKGSYNELIKVYQASEDKATCSVSKELYDICMDIRQEMENHKEFLANFKAREIDGIHYVAQPELRFKYIREVIFPAGTPNRAEKIAFSTENVISYAFPESGIEVYSEKVGNGYELTIERVVKQHSLTGISVTVGEIILHTKVENANKTMISEQNFKPNTPPKFIMDAMTLLTNMLDIATETEHNYELACNKVQEKIQTEIQESMLHLKVVIARMSRDFN